MSQHAAPATTTDTAEPTRVRFGVLAFACSLSMITYLDRVCFSTAVGPIIDDLGLKGEEPLAIAFSAFALAYAAFEVPSGWLGDVFGPRKTLIRIVLMWSLFTAMTGVIGLTFLGYKFGNLPDINLPWYGNVAGLVVAITIIRFIFGMGEAGAYPNITRALHNWFPYRDRGFSQGLVWMSGRFMGGLTALIWGLLVAGLSFEKIDADGTKIITKITDPLITWRTAFVLFGCIGVAWCILFALRFRNRPEEHPGVNAAELAIIHEGRVEEHHEHSQVPWGKLLKSSNLWILCLMYFCSAYGWYFNITFLPTFLETYHDVSRSSALGWIYKGGPLLFGAVACLCGGVFTDWFIRRTGDRRLGRRLLGIIGHTCCSLCYFSCLATNSAFTFFLATSFAAFFNDLTMGSAWATCQDIGRKYSGIVAGCMNTIGNLGGAVAPIVTAWIVKLMVNNRANEVGVELAQLSKSDKFDASLAGYEINFAIFGAVYIIAVLCWLKIDATKPVVDE